MRSTRQSRAKAFFQTLAMDFALNERQWIAGVLFAALALAVILYLCVEAPGGPLRRANWGFGPEWDCGDPIKASALVCIKKPAPKPN